MTTFVLSVLIGVALGMFIVVWLDTRRRQEREDRERADARRVAERRARDRFDDWGGG